MAKDAGSDYEKGYRDGKVGRGQGASESGAGRSGRFALSSSEHQKAHREYVQGYRDGKRDRDK